MKTFTIVAIILIVAAMALPAFALTWTEDFESYAAGTYGAGTNFPTGARTWTADTGVSSNYNLDPGDIVTTFAKDGTQSWKPGVAAPTNGASKQASRIRTSLGQGVGVEAYISAWIYAGPTAPGNSGTSWRSFIGFQQDTTGNSSIMRIGLNSSSTVSVQYFTTATQTVNTTAPGLVTNKWYFLELDMKRVGTSGTVYDAIWSVTPDGGTKATGTISAINWAGVANVNSVVLGYNNGTNNDVYWDSLSVTVPEPGSMLALGMGLVGLLGFVRRKTA